VENQTNLLAEEKEGFERLSIISKSQIFLSNSKIKLLWYFTYEKILIVFSLFLGVTTP
jgi:hypothetical protein